MERQLICALWAVKRVAQYALSMPELIVVLPYAAETDVLSGWQLPARLQARLVELSSFNCKYETGEGAWAIQDRVMKLADAAQEEETGKIWDHIDIMIRRPRTTQ